MNIKDLSKQEFIDTYVADFSTTAHIFNEKREDSLYFENMICAFTANILTYLRMTGAEIPDYLRSVTLPAEIAERIMKYYSEIDFRNFES